MKDVIGKEKQNPALLKKVTREEMAAVWNELKHLFGE